MRHHTVRMLGLAAAAVILSVGSAAAQGKGKGHDKDHGNKHDDDRDRGAVVDTRTGAVIGTTRRDDDHDGRGERRHDDDRGYGNGSKVPPGLAKKPGHMPPGQYRKRYGTQQGASVLGDIFGRNGYTVTRIVPSGQSQYVYYRATDGTVRRAIVREGPDRLQFSNVPQNILQAVLAQLY